mgnify:CR=1
MLADAIDEMIPRIRRDNCTHLARLQRKGRIFKGLLHLTFFKFPQITIPRVRRTIRSLMRVLGEGRLQAFTANPLFVSLELDHGVLGRQCDLLARATRDWIATSRVFDQQVCGSDLHLATLPAAVR